MNRSFLFTLLALVLVGGILLTINSQNKILLRHGSGICYLHFNWSTSTEAQEIMDTWRKNGPLATAIKNIVLADYLLIVIYIAYLLWLIRVRRKIERVPPPRTWMAALLQASRWLILTGALFDVIQDTNILYLVSLKSGRVPSLQILTWFKWATLGAGITIIVISLLPRSWVTRTRVRGYVDYFSGLLKSMWLFFPSILFIFLTIYCFWIRGQGKDIMVAFTEEGNKWRRLVFFLVIGFWIYVTWYSSRVIAYIKEQNRPFVGKFLDNYPRLAGNACLLAVELAILQIPILVHPLPLGWAFLIFFGALIGLYFADNWISRICRPIAGKLAQWLWIAFAVYFIILVITTRRTFTQVGYVNSLLILVIILHLIYLFYINLHRVMVNTASTRLEMKNARTFSERIIAFFCVPLEEKNFLRWLIWTSILAIAVYISAIISLDFARDIGPFSIVILAFATLLAFGNVMTAFSVRLNVNFHFILLLLAFLLGIPETHYVQQIQLENTPNNYDRRPSLEQYLATWLRRLPEGDSKYDMYFILANGGASRSAYWTASVLGRLEDASRQPCSADTFSRHLFCLSGTSGGGVGVATFFSLLADHRTTGPVCYQESAAQFLSQDYFTYTLARMLGPDYFNYIFHMTGDKDRGTALEGAFESYDDTLHYYNPSFYRPFSHFTTMNADGTEVSQPILFVNTTRMQDGNPGVVTNLKLESKYFGGRIDVLNLLPRDKDISMASAAILGARFPYLSPAGRIGNNYFVDGGYFDNSGAGVVQELIRGILNIAREDSMYGGGKIHARVRRLQFKVLHIINSPVSNTASFSSVAPINNDLFAPITTIVGAYDMQTTVNDDRLYHYICDIDKYLCIPSDYKKISLCQDSIEPPYSMNWFMSGSTRNRIDKRLFDHPEIYKILQPLCTPCKQNTK